LNFIVLSSVIYFKFIKEENHKHSFQKPLIKNKLNIMPVKFEIVKEPPNNAEYQLTASVPLHYNCIKLLHYL